MDFISRAIALFWIVILSPFFLLIVICSLLIQGRPILFKQKRVGKDFQLFNIFKFRTLSIKNNNNLFIRPNIIKISKWGRFLRNTKLDETPQLYNILFGNMRFIGPRPEIPEYVVNEKFDFLKELKPGLSGYSSIIFRNELEIMSLLKNKDPYDDILKIKIALDKYYQFNKSFIVDLKLVAITLLSLFMPRITGHYLLVKLLNEDPSKLDLKSILNSVKLRSKDLTLFKVDSEFTNPEFRQ